MKHGANPAESAGTPNWPLRGLMVVILAETVTRAFTPALFEHAPVVLALLDGRTSTLILLSEALPLPVFLLCAPIGMVLGSPFAYALGRYEGPRATRVLSRWMPTTGVIVQKAEALMKRWKGAPLVVLFGYLGCALAGAAEVEVGWFILFNIIGIALRLAIVLVGTQTFEAQAESLGAWVADHTVILTGLTASLVALDLYRGRRRRTTTES